MNRIDPNRECCPHGHLWEPVNIYVNPETGAKLCRACRTEGMRRSRGGLMRETVPHLPFPKTADSRPCTRESKAFWIAIVQLRRAGFVVRRISGKQHLVNGALLSAREVRQIADAVGARG